MPMPALPAASLLLACLLAPVSLAAEVTELPIKALDLEGKVLPGIRFSFGDVESLPTTTTGVTALQAPMRK